MYHLSVIIEIYDLRLQISILKEKLKLSSNYMRIEENFITVYGQMMGRLIGSFCEFRMYCILVHIRFKKWQLCGIANVSTRLHNFNFASRSWFCSHYNPLFYTELLILHFLSSPSLAFCFFFFLARCNYPIL